MSADKCVDAFRVARITRPEPGDEWICPECGSVFRYVWKTVAKGEREGCWICLRARERKLERPALPRP